MKTFSAKPLEVKRDWYVVDGSDKVLGRLACMKRPSRKCRPSTRAVPSKSL